MDNVVVHAIERIVCSTIVLLLLIVVVRFLSLEIEPCTVQDLPSERISTGDCVSEASISRQQCLGTCISGRKCRCCSPSATSTEQIRMACPGVENNQTVTLYQEKSYTKILSCACQECTDKNH